MVDRQIQGGYLLPGFRNHHTALPNRLTPSKNLLIPFWPRDIIIPGKNGRPENTPGNILVAQEGTRSGQLYFHLTRPRAGAIFYLQNLTALSAYCQQTETSAGGVVGGQWPVMGLALPPTVKGKPFSEGITITISDAFVAFEPELPKTEVATTRQYLRLLSRLYLQL